MVPIIIFLFLTLFSTTGGFPPHRRRLLHQPFFQVVPTSVPPSQPPSLPPSPRPLTDHQPLPKYPFSTAPPFTKQKPFFPSYNSPPPPPSSSVQTTFPANISSLLFPRHPSSTHHHVIILAISLSLFSAAIITAVTAIFLYFRSRQRGHSNKTSVSDNQRLFPPNLPPSDGDSKTATVHRDISSSNQPSTSSEFLYLGTLVNSRSQEIPPDIRNVGVKIGVSLAKSESRYQKLGSPELKPLLPLPKHNRSFTSGEMYFNKEEEDVTHETTKEEDGEEELFFSPRGSSGRKESRESLTPARIGSSSRRENFGSRSFNSRTASYPYSHSCSPVNSMTSSCHSPGKNLSPNFVISRFPQNVNNLSISSSTSSRSDSGDAQNSPDRVSSSSGKNKQSPTRSVPIKLPPPPPPLPPPRFWEIPTVARRSSGPPVLVAPHRADVIRSLGPSIANGQLDKNENWEKSEEMPRPKLKPLHWDKVRASSDRAMVWDQLKSSSFQ